jgi:predicted ribosome quality control (RQC) complex YloA/Tae2 family protein
MSLNWKEIDLVLSELDLAGAKIESVIQPSFDAIVLGLYGRGRRTELLLSISQGACRLHSLSAPPPKPSRPLRFMECLRSRIRGGRIEAACQLGEERIVRFDIGAVQFEGGEGGAAEAVSRRYRLYARLWSGAANLVLVDEVGLVIDALARRPGRGEVSGGRCSIEETVAAATPTGRVFEVRELPGEGTFNQRLEAWYSARGGELSRERLLETARDRQARKSRALGARVAELEKRAAEFRDSERLRELGDILMAGQGLPYQGKYFASEDFYRGGEIRIPVDPALDAVGNARSYYERHKKARSGLAEVEAELRSAGESLRSLDEEMASLEALSDPFLLARALAKGGAARTRVRRSYPGLSLERQGWTILVGRSAKENDELLRRHVRGSDLWLHARDWPGSYVFVKARKGKTVPLDILLDAGNLAIYYSKGRSNGGGDVYHTFAKYLRRAKDGPKGLVIPTQEKNISVRLDEARLRELKALIGDDAGV